MTQSYTYISNLMGEIQIPEKGILSRTLHNKDGVKTVLFAFAQGEELSEHTASMPAILHFLQGEAELTLDSARVEAGDETLIHMPTGMRHSIKAITPVIMLLLLLKGNQG